MHAPLRRSWLTSAWLVAKVNRFELIACLLSLGLLTIFAFVAAQAFAAIPADSTCLRSWLASVAVSPSCQSAIEQWSALSEGNAGKIMAAMAIAPAATGLILGVPLVARELDSGTAPMVWALAGSRWRWYARQVIPFGALVMVAMSVAALGTSLLADARSGNNIWSSTYVDADLFGPPVVGRAMAAFGIGLLAGATTGRMLPALLIASGLTFVAFVIVGLIGVGVVSSTHPLVDVGKPGAALEFIRENPDTDVLFVLPDDRVVTMADAPSAVPPNTPDPVAWLADHARLVPLGVARSATTRWQVIETAILAVIAAVSLAAAGAFVRRRSPR